jgi:uncharacterized glyoxalase superfamily protein PhnB
MSVSPIPEGFSTVTPYLIVDDVDELIRFLSEAFDAKCVSCVRLPDGKVLNCTIDVGNSKIFASSAREGMEAMPGMHYLYVEDVDAVFEKAIAAGAEVIMKPSDQFYGDRSAGLSDKNGMQWWLGSRIEILSDEEVLERMQYMGEED